MLLRNSKFALYSALVLVLLTNYSNSQTTTDPAATTAGPTTAAPTAGPTTAAASTADPATGSSTAAGGSTTAPAGSGTTAPPAASSGTTGAQPSGGTSTSAANTGGTSASSAAPTTPPTYVNLTLDEYNQLKRDIFDYRVAIIIIGIFTFLSFVGLITGFLYLLFKIPKITRF